MPSCWLETDELRLNWQVENILNDGVAVGVSSELLSKQNKQPLHMRSSYYLRTYFSSLLAGFLVATHISIPNQDFINHRLISCVSLTFNYMNNNNNDFI